MDIILAAGTQTRWNHKQFPNVPKIKQLVKVDGGVLIEVIQKQFDDPVVVTHDKEIRLKSKKVFRPTHNECTIATLFSTCDMWYEWTTILLGDVLYGEETIKLIKGQTDKLMFYGDKGEIYAIKWHKDVNALILYCINKMINAEYWSPKFGKLWNLYRTIIGRDFRLAYIPDKYFTFVSDCRDFDNQEQYLKYAQNKGLYK